MNIGRIVYCHTNGAQNIELQPTTYRGIIVGETKTHYTVQWDHLIPEGPVWKDAVFFTEQEAKDNAQ